MKASIKSKDEILNFMTSLEKIFIEFVGADLKPMVVFVKEIEIKEENILFAVKKEEEKIIENISNRRIALVGWKGLEGYQIKGTCQKIKMDNVNGLYLEVEKIYDIKPGNEKGLLYTLECIEKYNCSVIESVI